MTTAYIMMAMRQITNNFLFVMDITLGMVLILYIASHIQAYNATYAWSLVRVRAAMWLGIHLIGLTLQRAWGIVLLRAVADGKDAMSVEAHFPIYFIGSIIAAIGLAGTIYTFTPLAGSHTASTLQRYSVLMLSLTIATIFTVIMQVF